MCIGICRVVFPYCYYSPEKILLENEDKIVYEKNLAEDKKYRALVQTLKENQKKILSYLGISEYYMFFIKLKYTKNIF